MLADAFESFQNMCPKLYELDPAKKFSTAGLAWEAALKRTKKDEGIKGGIRHFFYRYAKAKNKCMKVYDKNKESSYFQH